MRKLSFTFARKDAVEAIEREKAIYRILGRSPHPNIIRSFLGASEGIFLERMTIILQKKIFLPEPISKNYKASSKHPFEQ
jgi:hypothetical protein